MSVITANLKYFLKLFPSLLVLMLGVGHTIVEFNSLMNHTAISIFEFRFEPTLWTFLVTLFVTIAASIVSVKVMFKRW